MRRTYPIASGRHLRREIGILLRRHARGVLGAAVLLALAAAAAAVPPWLVGRLIDRVSAGAGIGEVIAIVSGMAASVLVHAAALLFGVRLAVATGEDVFADLREQFVRDALAMPGSLVEDAGVGELINRTTRDVGAVNALVRDAVPQMLIGSATVLFIVIGVLSVAPAIAPAFLVGVPILALVVRWLWRTAPEVYRAENAAYGPMIQALMESVDGAETVSALGLEQARAEATERALRGYWRVTVPVIRLRMISLPWANVAVALPVVTTLAWGGWLATQGRVTVGDVAAATLYAVQLAVPMETMTRWVDELQTGLVALARVVGIGEADDSPAAPAQAPSSSTLRMRDVGFSYRPGIPVLNGVTLEVMPGERLAMIGSSGAGKSTIVRLLSGLHAPSSGTVTVGGVDIASIRPADRRHQVLLVSQESHVFATTVAENVRLGREGAGDAAVAAALDQVGASGWVAALDDGADTVVGAGGHELSGAQEQQLALARIVLADPHTLILDEATSLMDPREARELERALAAALRGRTVVAVAHRLHTAYDADRVAVIEEGRIIELGSHDELVAAGGAYARLWSLWRDDGAETRGG